MTTTTKRDPPPRAFLLGAGHFVLHLLEMCMACCVGGATLGVAFFGGAALLGYPDLIGRASFFSTLVLAVILTVPMVGWMRSVAIMGGGHRLGWASSSLPWACSVSSRWARCSSGWPAWRAP
jgi:hypothetical protein